MNFIKNSMAVLAVLFFSAPLCSFAKPQTLQNTAPQISWPVQNGTVVKKFSCSKNQTTKCMEGIQISSPQKEIVSPSNGVVVFSDKSEGKGFLVVIKSKSFYTVVYNLKNISVKPTQNITQGEKIGESLNNTVYLELRDLQGNAHNPEKFITAAVSPQPQKTQKVASQSKSIYPHQENLFPDFVKFMRHHGFQDKDIPKMYCIAVWESSLNPKAINYNKNGTYDVGIFQINQIWEKPCRMSKNDMFDVKNNTKCALQVLNTQGINAWVTWKKHWKHCYHNVDVMVAQN